MTRATPQHPALRPFEYHLSFDGPMVVWRSKTFCVFARDEDEAATRFGALLGRTLDRWKDSLHEQGWRTWIP